MGELPLETGACALSNGGLCPSKALVFKILITLTLDVFVIPIIIQASFEPILSS